MVWVCVCIIYHVYILFPSQVYSQHVIVSVKKNLHTFSRTRVYGGLYCMEYGLYSNEFGTQTCQKTRSFSFFPYFFFFSLSLRESCSESKHQVGLIMLMFMLKGLFTQILNRENSLLLLYIGTFSAPPLFTYINEIGTATNFLSSFSLFPLCIYNTFCTLGYYHFHLVSSIF